MSDRMLGRTGVRTSAMALGCARLGSVLTPLSRRECVSLVAQAFDLGVRHFDTASIYGQGDSERYIGEALRGNRDAVCLASKAGQRLGAAQSLMAHFKGPMRWLAARRGAVRQSVAAQRAQGVRRCFSPDYLQASLHASLSRLRTDHLDLFYLHSPEPGVLRDDALFERLQRLRERGLFRALAVSCDDAQTAWVAAAHPAVDVVQFAYAELPDADRLLMHLAALGKSAVLRGLVQSRGGPADLQQVFARMLALPAAGSMIVGTTQAAHLRANVAAFQAALRQEASP